jgi:hypothetical protein
MTSSALHSTWGTGNSFEGQLIAHVLATPQA